MARISIDNFGPIDGHFEMDLDKKLTILIGEQATGKSTIAKLVVFCEHALCDGFDLVPKASDAVINMLKMSLARNDSKLYYCDSYNNEFNLSNKSTWSNSNGGFHSDSCLYIPAGRSIIPLIFESYAAASRIKLDPLTDEFLLLMDSIRKDFSKPLSFMLTAAVSAPKNIDSDVNVFLLETIFQFL